MNCTRSGGYAGSSGRYAPPAFKIPSTPTTRSSERSIRNPTRTSGPTPSDCNRHANPFARRSNSPKVNDSPSHTTATRSDPSRTRSSNRSCKHPATSNTDTPSPSNELRSSSETSGRRATASSGRATTPRSKVS